ncbi:ABC transporter permease [Tsukamurella sp. 1534]|uniref:ABC transporter permease n=1 Tax=Tsukamurella sp. 1534 TaxID=1151061 RepID=UPI00192A8B29|nr:ABC transporter permease [Tsukamurella sp. 1534]
MVNEFAKMRRLRSGPIALALFVLTLAIVFYSASGPGFVPGAEHAWNLLLTGIGQGALTASPLLIAVLASRQVDIEHLSKGWLSSATSGAAAGRVSRAKFVALGVIVTTAVALAAVIALVAGVFVLGNEIPLGRWCGITLSVLVINLVVLAVHVVLAARIENQLAGIGVGLLGLVFALVASGMPDWVNHLVPWGYYTLAMPAEYRGTTLVSVPPAHVSVAVLGVVVIAAFALVTGRLDRQEA